MVGDLRSIDVAKRQYERGFAVVKINLHLTIKQHACFPSMKPFGMALAARISYLRTQRKNTHIKQDGEEVVNNDRKNSSNKTV